VKFGNDYIRGALTLTYSPAEEELRATFTNGGPRFDDLNWDMSSGLQYTTKGTKKIKIGEEPPQLSAKFARESEASECCNFLRGARATPKRT